MPRSVLRRSHSRRQGGVADGLVLLGLAGLIGVGAFTVRRFERAAERDVASRLDGPDKRVKLRVSYPGILSPGLGEISRAEINASHFSVRGLPFLREPWRSSKGTIDRMVVDLHEFELTGLPVARLYASIPNVRFDLAHAARHAQIRISRSGVGRAEVTLRPEAIAAWLMKRTPGLKNVTARIEDGKLGVAGRFRFAGFEIPFDVLSVVSGDGPRLSLKNPRILIAGVPAEGPKVEALAKALNPVVDTDRDLALQGAVGIERVSIRDGLIVASGTVTLPEATDDRKPPSPTDSNTKRGGLSRERPPRERRS